MTTVVEPVARAEAASRNAVVKMKDRRIHFAHSEWDEDFTGCFGYRVVLGANKIANADRVSREYSTSSP